MERLFQSLGWPLRVEPSECPNLNLYSVSSEVPGLEEIQDTADLTILGLLKDGGATAFKSENGFWTVLWTLLYWDVIFQKLPESYDDRFGHAFPTEEQDIPKDLFKREFYANHEELFDARSAEIAAKGLESLFASSFSKNSGTYTRLLESLPSFDSDVLKQAVGALETSSTLKLLDRLSKNYNSNRSGLPDLFVHADEVTLLEVKGPGDSAKQNQVDWLRYLGGYCKFEVGVLAIGWSDRKLANLIKKLNGPSGTIKIGYGKSGSKYFKEVEETVSNWPEVDRQGEGQSLQVTASLPVSRIGEALPVIKMTSRWKQSFVEFDGQAVEAHARSPFRCLAEKESTFQGQEYCSEHWNERIATRIRCRQFGHNAFSSDLGEYGYRDTERSAFVVDKEKIRSELDVLVANLAVCPHFEPKRVWKEFERIPESIDPRQDKDWAWVDSDGEQWFYEKGQWLSSWGKENFPGVANMVGIAYFSPMERRMARNLGSFSYHEETVPATQKQGCVAVLAALVGSSALIVAILLL